MRKWKPFQNFPLIQENKLYVIFALLLLIVIFTIQNINDRFWLNDFKVYYLAAQNLLKGDPVYGVAFGLDTGFYKYSPFILLTFVPFTFVSYFAASVIHYVAIGVAAVVSTLCVQNMLLRKVLSSQSPGSKYILPAVFICVLNHLFRELHLGNVNMIIVCLLCAALYFQLNGKELKTGLLLGMIVLIKPYFLLLSLPLLLHKKFKSLFSQSLTLLCSFVLVVFFFGFTKTLELHSQWVRAILLHSEYLTSEHTIAALTRKYVFSGMLDSYQFYVFVFFTLTYVLVFYLFIRPRIQGDPKKENGFLFLSYFTLLALIPNILITDTEHFLFTLPLLIYSFHQFSNSGRFFYKFVFVFFVLVYGTSGGDIFGSAVNKRFEELGLLGIANLGIVFCVLFLFSKDIYRTNFPLRTIP